ncbi:putative virion structural protein [Klebsiella phage N1M2]|uniref:Putative virion structural protein n=1 Tax=Klebsiella phage N1M2 TaxID=2664939 RepID=A0A6B7ZER9_9CAUD|nr:tail protein [Klebsiella phage N1M2]QGH71980.1 putative virion structural protein [Klebsiella phage N1M2]
MKDLDIVDIDYSAKKAEFKKEDKVDLAKISPPWIVPEEGPMYGDNTLRVIRGGLDLVRGKDWVPVTDVPKLSELTGKPVYLYIELKDHVLATGGEVSVVYQRVGKPVISVKTLLDMLQQMVIEGKPVDWETQINNKPDTYYPAWHSHDIQNPNELVGFGGLVELFSMFTYRAKADGGKVRELLEKLQKEVWDKLNYTQKLLWGVIMDHSRNYQNPHKLKPADIDLGNVGNFATATPQQDADAMRDDLYSTPAGLKRLTEELAPDTEDFIVQSELPFGYFGSGIYIPPPITGSFEGLGGDYENSAFCQEGNGWTVGLLRAFDGRVKNLYYIYKTDVRNRDEKLVPWLHTYVQYQHPTITADGLEPNYVINGSNNDIIMLGVSDNPTEQLKADEKFYISLSNSTFDPNSHEFKETNFAELRGPEDLVPAAGYTTIAHVGSWVYLIVSYNTKEGFTQPDGVGVTNYQQWFYRAKYSDINNKDVDKVVFQQVDVTYDNVSRVRKSGKAMAMIDYQANAAGEITRGLVNYIPSVTTAESHRRRQFIIVNNPNNPALSRVRILAISYATKTTQNSAYAGWANLIVDYEWNGETNTWTLSPHWEFGTWSVETGSIISPTKSWLEWCNGNNESRYHSQSFAINAGSYIPGFGFVSIGSRQTGTPPLMAISTIYNRDGDPQRDYEYMGLPPNWTTDSGLYNGWWNQMVLRSPFGVSGFPRFYADLYRLDGKIRQTPIEIFMAETEDQDTASFYRITEGGEGDNYDKRDSLQSKYIQMPIYGRKTNSNFGKVSGTHYDVATVNRPKKKDVKSRETGVFGYLRRGIIKNPGAPYMFSRKTYDDGSIKEIVQENDGSIIVNLNLNFTMEPLSKVIYAKPIAQEKLRIPKAIWEGVIKTALETHYSKTIDMGVSFYVCQDPGTNADQPYCMFSIIYHITDNPRLTRSIIGRFNWDVESVGADGIRVMKMGAIDYPFSGSNYAKQRLVPPSQNPENVISYNEHQTNTDGSWAGLEYRYGLNICYPHVEILDFPEEGPRNMEICWFTGIQIKTTGNATTQRTFLRVRNNQTIEATSATGNGQSFNEYYWQVQANPQWGWLQGVPAAESGGAMDLMVPWKGPEGSLQADQDKYVMLGATYVEGNWSVFINADINVTFNGYSMPAKMTNWDLRDLTDVYRDSTFYLYCVSDGSAARYDISKVLRHHNPSAILVGVITTDSFGIVTIQRYQSFTISGYPLTRQRDTGVPVSSGAITEQGTYKFLKRSELYTG